MFITNCFKKEDVFCDAVEYQELPPTEIFKAEYYYGAKEEQISKKNTISNLFETLVARLFQPLIYPGCSMKLDSQRVLKTKHQLQAIGGKSIALKTPDGDSLEGMYMKASDFKASLEKYFYVFKEKNSSENTIEKSLTLKEEFCIEEQKGSFFSYTYLKPNEEAKQFIEHLQGLRFDKLSSTAPLPFSRAKKCVSIVQKIIYFIQSCFIHKVRGYNLTLSSLSQKFYSFPNVDTTTSQPTVIISCGNSSIYTCYKELATQYLMRGINVMLFNPRGYGNSNGCPTSYKTKLDLETAYQYLSKEKKVENKDLIVHGNCIGGGSSTDLAARRKGTNLVLDRSFATFNDEAKKRAIQFLRRPNSSLKKISSNKYWNNFVNQILPSDWSNKKISHKQLRDRISLYLKKNQSNLSSLFARIISLGVEYDSIANLKKIKGKIVLVIDKHDEVIEKDAGEKQIKSCREKTVLFTDLGHDTLWINKEGLPTKQFEKFLLENNLYRKVI